MDAQKGDTGGGVFSAPTSSNTEKLQCGVLRCLSPWDCTPSAEGAGDYGVPPRVRTWTPYTPVGK